MDFQRARKYLSALDRQIDPARLDPRNRRLRNEVSLCQHFFNLFSDSYAVLPNYAASTISENLATGEADRLGPVSTISIRPNSARSFTS